MARQIQYYQDNNIVFQAWSVPQVYLDPIKI